MVPSRSAVQLSWAQVCARRLHRHGLLEPIPDAGPADVAAAICGAHAQVLTAAELSIGLRGTSLTRTDVSAALWSEHSLVKTFGPRGTVHLLPARELSMWTGALSAVPSTSGLAAESRLSPEQTDEVVAAIGAVLAEAELTVDELSEAVVAATGPWAADPVIPAFQEWWPRWRQAVTTAAYRGVLCFGPNRGRRVTYTSPARWFPGFRPQADTPALAELVRRFLHAYGPATPQHFAQWLAAPRRWAAELFDSLSDDLAPVEVDGTVTWERADDPGGPSVPEGVRLLPYFDAYSVGCHPRPLVFPGQAAVRALAGGQAGNYPVLIVAGTVAGVWHLKRTSRRLAITVEPFTPLTARQRGELDDQVERIGAVLEGRPTLTIGDVTAGAHA